MSCDFAVWDQPRITDAHEARRIYEALCNGDESVVNASQKVRDFLDELTGIYPQIDDYPEADIDDCPWSIAFDTSAGHVIMCCVWSRAEEIDRLVKGLARKYELVCYDPQSDAVID